MEPTDARRFAFGQNWQAFRRDALDAARIDEARRGLARLVPPEALAGRSFLDVGSGSGLHSLAALQLGAARVVSFDYDPDSVACTAALRAEQAPTAAGDEGPWTVLRGSVLDEGFMTSLGRFDVVYSWGVLHHTGAMWSALRQAAGAVAPGGTLAIALYNAVPGSLGTLSSASWRAIKRAYVAGGPARQAAILSAYTAWRLAVSATRFRNPLRELREYRRHRGMSWFHDARDWLGGYPYEYASVDEVLAFVEPLGFARVRVVPEHPQGWGNNEFVFRRSAP